MNVGGVKRLLASSVIVLLLCGAGWALFAVRAPDVAVRPRLLSAPDKAEVALLQSLASKACTCESLEKAGQGTHCWHEYNAAVSMYPVTEAATACDPISTIMDCFGAHSGDGPCIVKGYNVIGLPKDVNPRVCTDADARTIEDASVAAFALTQRKPAKDVNAAISDAVIEALKEIRNGKISPMRQVNKTCG